MKKLVFLAAFMIMLLAACNGASDAPVVEEIPTSTVQPVPSQTVRVTATIRPTNTPLPTFTYTPTLTLVPPTVTATFTPSITPTVGGIISAQQAINVRSGPGTEYDVITALPAGTGVQIINQSPDGEWLNIRLLEDGREGWISNRFVRIEPTQTPFPSMTPSPDLTALFLGTPLAPTQLANGRATATPPEQVRTGTPETRATIPPIQTEGPLLGVPTIDNSSIYLTATALAGGLSNPTRTTAQPQTTNDRTIAVATSSGGTTTPNTTAATPLPQPTATLGTGRSVRIFAFCDNSATYGSAITTVPVLRAGDTVRLYWAWIASTEDQINDHLEASNLELAVNGEIINGANDMHGAIQPFNPGFIVYWEVPIGPLTSGEYVVTYQVTWDRAIYDGLDFYGPDTPHPFEQESCTFTVP